MLEDRHVKGANLEDAISFAKSVSEKHPGSKVFICSDDKHIALALKDDPFIMFDKEYVMTKDWV